MLQVLFRAYKARPALNLGSKSRPNRYQPYDSNTFKSWCVLAIVRSRELGSVELLSLPIVSQEHSCVLQCLPDSFLLAVAVLFLSS